MMSIPNAVPLRCTCVWVQGEPGPRPKDWIAVVSRVLGVGDLPADTNTSGIFAGLEYHSVPVPDVSPTTREERAALTRTMERELGGKNLTVAITSDQMALRGPVLVVLDGDSTLFQEEGIDLVAKHAGTETEVAAITAAAMRGELDFAQSLRKRMSTLARLPATVLDEVRRDYHLSPGAMEMVAALHRGGAKVGVVSGGFCELVEPAAREIGLDFIEANRFEIVDGKLTGRPRGEIVTADTKAQRLRGWAAELGVAPEQCVAMGDGANDMKMLAAAGLGIAYVAKPALQEVADTRIGFPNLAAAALLSSPVSQILPG